MILPVIFLVLNGGFYLETDTFGFPGSAAVAFSENKIFLLWEDKIKCFNSKGEEMFSFGEQGEGPGAFFHPHYLQIKEGVLYLKHDVFKATFFDLNGHFLRQMNDPKLMKGEILLGEVAWMDWSHRNPDSIRWLHGKKEINHVKIPDYSFPERSMKHFIPLSERPFCLVDPSGSKLAMVSIGHPLSAWVYDGALKKLKSLNLPNWPKLPFNEAWGKSQYDLLVDGSSQYVLKNPEYFPILKSLSWGPNNILIFQLWTSFPDKTKKYKALNLKGEEQTFDWLPYWGRVVGWSNSQVAICSYSSDEDVPAKILVTTWVDMAANCKELPFKLESPQPFVEY